MGAGSTGDTSLFPGCWLSLPSRPWFVEIVFLAYLAGRDFVYLDKFRLRMKRVMVGIEGIQGPYMSEAHVKTPEYGYSFIA